MNLFTRKYNEKNYYIISFKNDEQSSIEVISPTVGNIFLAAKSCLDQKVEVIICNELPIQIDSKKLSATHYLIKEDEYLYLNISIRNQVTKFFRENLVINDIQSLIKFFQKNI